MNNIVSIEPAGVGADDENPTRRTIRRRSRVVAFLFTAALTLAIAFAFLLVGAVLFYDGPLLAFGPGGVWIGQAPDAGAGLLPLTAFSFFQRLTGAFALTLLTAPAIFIFFHLRGLFRLYSNGVVFAVANARHIKFTGIGLVAYAFGPFLANRSIWLAGVTTDPIWFHVDEVQALVIGTLLFVIANVMEFGRAIEQERDGFI
ncbi:MAG: DUF2975 domain-containing protein [Methylocystis sp.]|nr:DUF2975 domain-containing protein [Methylocystis sp.]